MGSSNDARSRIMGVTIELINECEDINALTIRQIADNANVGVGLINYHFKSKDNLFNLAIGQIMQEMLKDVFTKKEIVKEPLEKLKYVLKLLADFGKEHMQITNFMLKQCLINGNLQAELLLIPFLKEICKDKKNDMDLRIIAMQIIMPIQSASLSIEQFEIYSGINLYDKEQRDKFIEVLIDNILKKN